MSDLYYLSGKYETFGTARTSEPGFLNRTIFNDESKGKYELERIQSSRRRRGLCPIDGFPLKLRSASDAEVVVVCPKCKGTTTWLHSNRYYRMAVEKMERESR